MVLGVMIADEVLKAVLTLQDDDTDEQKSSQADSTVVDQYKLIIREQVNHPGDDCCD